MTHFTLFSRCSRKAATTWSSSFTKVLQRDNNLFVATPSTTCNRYREFATKKKKKGTQQNSKNKHADNKKKKDRVFSVDTSTMFDSSIHLPDKPKFSDPSLGYEESTPLSDELIRWIGIRGPISTAEYVRMALTHPQYGYYTSSQTFDEFDDDDDGKTNSKIGKHGDFTTAPEISQVFGECVFLFFLSLWQQQQQPKPCDLIEMGPGKGTLMYDILYTAIHNFPNFVHSVDRICLVEVSPELRQLQRKTLERLNSADHPFEFVFHPEQEDGSSSGSPTEEKRIHISWHTRLDSIPTSSPSSTRYIVGQELLDTLPVHTFQKTDEGWREILVDVDTASNPVYSSITDKQKRPRLRFVLSKDVTESTRNLILENPLMDEDKFQVGDVVEVSSDGCLLINYIQKLIDYGGAALLIDYGYMDGEIVDSTTLRAFRKHTQVHPLTLPGQVDLTADVNFGLLKRAADSSSFETVQTLAPVTQQHFLMSMGIIERVVALIENEKTSEEQANDLANALERLIGEEKGMMGKTYKAMALVKAGDSVLNIPGF